MVADDPLAAAKSAALQELLSLDNVEQDPPVSPSSKPLPSARPAKAHRRRRRRQQVDHDVSSKLPSKPSTWNVEYVPESVDARAAEAIAREHDAAAVELIMSAINRFTEMGPDASGKGLSQNEENAKSGLATRIGQSNLSAEQDERSYGEEANGTSLDPKTVQPLSRKKQKELRRNFIARLKEIADKPEVVEAWDINSPDPVLLVHLKALPNSVPVPVNWSQKRKYLQNKRGMEKRPFQLPAYIMETGVGSLRDAQIESDEKKTLKQKQREKMRAKTGKGIEIDTQRLHDAFFKFQTKPRLTKHGEVYFELKELETDPSQFVPGYLSEELRAALGISENDPPPWLINMQRYGPPPSYQGLKVPGVNAPIPPGARFGYQVGGWGKPPVDPSGRPIYGDVFGEGISYGGDDFAFETPQSQKDFLWGEMKAVRPSVTVKADVLTDDAEEEDEDEDDVKKLMTGWTPTPLPTTEGTGQRRDDVVDGRRDGREDQHMSTNVRKGIADGNLFTVLEQRKVSVSNKEMMGSSHIYDMEKSDAAEMHGRNVGHREKRPHDNIGQQNEEEDLDKRKRDTDDDNAKSMRPKKRQKEFKF